MVRRSWVTSVLEAVRDAWVVGEAILSFLATFAGIYQNGVESKGWPALFPGPPLLSSWQFFVLGYLLLFLAFATAYHKLAVRVDLLTEQGNEQWRKERQAFEDRYDDYRTELSRFLMTIKNLLISAGQRQMVGTLQEYLPPDPRTVDAELYAFAYHLWLDGWTLLGDESSLEALKDRFRKIHGFFDRVYDLQQEFPQQARPYIEQEVQKSQYAILHLVWYFGHAFSDLVSGNDKARQYSPPPRWNRLWSEWNPGVALPIGPRETLATEDRLPTLSDSPRPYPLKIQVGEHVVGVVRDYRGSETDNIDPVRCLLQVQRVEITNLSDHHMTLDLSVAVKLGDQARFPREHWDLQEVSQHFELTTVEVPAHKATLIKKVYRFSKMDMLALRNLDDVAEEGHLLRIKDRQSGESRTVALTVIDARDHQAIVKPLTPGSAAPPSTGGEP